MRGAKLTALKSKMYQSEVCVVFGLTVARAKALPHAIETDYYRGTPLNYRTYPMRVFNAERVLVSLLADGGWRAVAALLAKFANKKRKRDDLEDRRAAALAGRRAKIDAWFDTARPVGADVASIDDWAASIEKRGWSLQLRNTAREDLRAFLFYKEITAPSLKKAKEAVKRTEHMIAVYVAQFHARRLGLLLRKSQPK